MEGCEVLIVGCGIIGLTVARELVARGAGRVVLVEKEARAGAHASGRNSGVLHAGVYYSPGTLKARFCVEGNRLLKAYCRERGLALDGCGKVIVAKDGSEAERLDEIRRRAVAGGATVRMVDEAELRHIEPHALTCERALYCPETAVVEPRQIVDSLVAELKATGRVEVRYGTRFLAPAGAGTARLSSGRIAYDYLVNAAGVYADAVAHSFSVGLNYAIVPFKGTYRRLSDAAARLVRGNIYPVPDLRNPFLGVHFTRSISGDVYVGPNALPVLGREHYGLVRGVSGESLLIVWRNLLLALSDPGYRAAALAEAAKLWPGALVRQLRRMVPALSSHDVLPSPKAGIRAQLVDLRSRRLVHDFVVIKRGRTVHVLNAVSPAFTCSMAFAPWVADVLEDDSVANDAELAPSSSS